MSDAGEQKGTRLLPPLPPPAAGECPLPVQGSVSGLQAACRENTDPHLMAPRAASATAAASSSRRQGLEQRPEPRLRMEGSGMGMGRRHGIRPESASEAPSRCPRPFTQQGLAEGRRWCPAVTQGRGPAPGARGTGGQGDSVTAHTTPAAAAGAVPAMPLIPTASPWGR